MWQTRYDRFGDVLREGAVFVFGLKAPTPGYTTPTVWAVWPVDEAWPTDEPVDDTLPLSPDLSFA
jgi:hypothetical protein